MCVFVDHSGRRAEARQLAEEALAIKQTLDPGAAEIWTTYSILATMTDKEAASSTDQHLRTELQAKAREHRRFAREAKRAFPATRHELKKHARLIIGTIVALRDTRQRPQTEQALTRMEQHGWTRLVPAIRRIIAGERDSDALCSSLDLEDSMIVETILQGLTDPSTLSDLLPPDGPVTNAPGG